MSVPPSPIQALAQRQLDAYNRGDLDAFCACYHPQVQVLEADGSVDIEGMEDFRPRYAGLWTDYREVKASVPQRLAHGAHCVDLEHWSRVEAETGERQGGTVLVRYTLREGLIGTVQFLD
ncbi:MAG: nuclear transport factor 2 family protein [Myxococcota bacterium]|nr:nuclear transport factor 2 family protein [Myxococcota bacterium]